MFLLLECSLEELEDALQRSHRAANFPHDYVDTWRGRQGGRDMVRWFVVALLKIIAEFGQA